MKAPKSSFDPFNRPLATGQDFVLILGGASIVVIALFLFQLFSQGPSTTSAIVSRGDRIILIRLLPVLHYLQEDILISGTDAVGERNVSRGPADVRAEGVSINSYNRKQLTSTEWQTLEAQRRSWCQQSPRFAAVSESMPFYDIAIRCGSKFDSKRYIVPLTQLPPAFAALIDSVPSPQGSRECEQSPATILFAECNQ